MSYNLIGKRFGRLLVTGHAPRGEKYPRQQWWHCICDCGKEIDLPTNHLTSGHWKSCGCLQAESRMVDITGQRRGSLTAVRPTGEIYRWSSGSGAVWVWRCDCGKEIEAPAAFVGCHGRTSCGCKRRPLNVQQAEAMRTRQKRVEGTMLGALTRKAGKNNTSGIKGVHWHKGIKKWYASISFKGKSYSLGYYKNIEDAAAARKRAEEKLFKPMLDKYADKQV